MSNALQIITQEIYGVRAGFEAVTVDRSINFEREAGFAIQILSNSEYALSVAMNNRRSVIDAVTNISAIGISLNPAKKLAYLVPRDKKICLDISYMGLLDLAISSGSILWGQAE
ncbi:MAG: recombinase RecT, partial [Ralstonia sp.]|nr:recombinase RecT [Ralstonia sp.]